MRRPFGFWGVELLIWPFLFIVGATILWGFGFIATKWALDLFAPLTLIVIRMLVAWGITEAWASYRGIKNQNPAQQLHMTRWAWINGFLLAGLMIFQTIGIQYTTATNSAFLTTLYAVMVPLICVILFKVKLPRTYWLALSLAMAGTWLLCGGITSGLNFGDGLTIIGAIFAAIHIIGLEMLTRKPVSITIFNARQYAVAATVTLPLVLVFEHQRIAPMMAALMPNEDIAIYPLLPLLGLLFLAIPSTVISFSLQTVAQKHLPSTTASLGLLMESPFAMVFAYALLDEKLKMSQGIGAGLVILAAVLVILPQIWQKNQPPPNHNT